MLVVDGLPYIWYSAPRTPTAGDTINPEEGMDASTLAYPGKVWRSYTGGAPTNYTSNVSNPLTENFWVYATGGYAEIGSTSKFNAIRLDYGASDTFTGTVGYQYWNGSAWTAFTPTTDQTLEGATDGTIVLDAPSDWTASQQHSETDGPWYYIRINTLTTTGTAYIQTVRVADGVERTLHTGLTNLSPAGTTFDPETCFASGGQVSLQVAVLDDNHANELLRIGIRGADHRCTLAAPLTQTTSVDGATGTRYMEVNEDISEWDSTGYLHIGQEAITYQGRTTSSPYKFELIQRGAFDTRVRSHDIDEARGFYPRVRSEPTTWTRRPARVYIASVPYGTVADGSDWTELCNGYIRETPAVTSNGRLIGLTVTPWTSALKEPLEGSGRTTSLQTGYHIFDGSVGNYIEGSVAQIWREGNAFNERVASTTAAGVSPPVINDIAWQTHSDVFDVTQLQSVRRGDILIGANQTRYQLNSTGGNTTYIPNPLDRTGGIRLGTDPLPVSVTAEGERVRNAQCQVDVKASGWVTPGTAAAVSWPQDLMSALNSAWTPGTKDGSDGLWADMSVIPFDGSVDSAVLQLWANYASAAGPMYVKLSHPNSMDEALVAEPRDNLWYGLSFQDPDDYKVINLTDGSSGIDGPLSTRSGFIREEVAVDAAIDDENREPTKIRIKGFADAFWQTGEKFILVEEDIFPDAPFAINVEWEEAGQTYSQRMRITSKSAATASFAGVPGYLLRVDDDWKTNSLSFGTWRGASAPKITTSNHWRNDLPWVVMLQLLLSSEGGTYGGVYDVLPYGLGLSTDEVDVDSFIHSSLPAGRCAQIDDLWLTDETNIQDFIESMLKLNGVAIVTKLGTDGKRRLTLVSNGQSGITKTVGSITDNDWADGGRPVTHNQVPIINAIEVECNVTREGDSLLTVRVEDRPAIAEHGRSEVESIKAPWLQLQQESEAAHEAALFAPAVDRFALFNAPRREYEGTVAYSLVSQLDVGDTVLVSASNVWTTRGVKGLTNAPMRLLSIKPNLKRNSATVRLAYYPLNMSGWAPAARASYLPTSTLISFSNNTYSDVADGLKDIEYFSEGDIVRLVPPGDFDSATVRTIDTISGSSVTFTEPHGQTTGSSLAGLSMRSVEWNEASTDHKRYVFMCDADGKLGAIDTVYTEWATKFWTTDFSTTTTTDITANVKDCSSSSTIISGVSDDVEIGHLHQFHRADFVITPSSPAGFSVTWTYWNGATWAALTLSTNTTANMTHDGYIEFTPPVDWAPTTLHAAGGALYYIKGGAIGWSSGSTAVDCANVRFDQTAVGPDDGFDYA